MERIYWFLLVFFIVYFLEAIGHSYITSAVQNIERQYQLPSKVSGFLVSASDIGYIPSVIFISYFGSRGNRAKWIGAGTIILAIGYLAMATPNFIYPVVSPQPNMTKIQNSLHPTAEQLEPTATLRDLLAYPLIKDRIPHPIMVQLREISVEKQTPKINFDNYLLMPDNSSTKGQFLIDGWLLNEAIDEADEVLEGRADATRLRSLLSQYVRARANHTQMDLWRVRRSATAPFAYCSSLVNKIREVLKDMRCEEQSGSMGPFLIFFLSLFVLGIGKTVPWSLGVPMVDDNVKRTKAPAYFAFMSFMKIFGPVCGHLLATFCYKFYYTSHAPLGLTPSDPTWIGAWWMGFLIIGFVSLIPALVLFFFPTKSISSKYAKDGEVNKVNLFDKYKVKDAGDKTLGEKGKEFIKSYSEVVGTKLYMGAVIGRICDMLAMKGYITFLPKYLENHFGIPQFKVHQYIAAFGTFGVALGTLAGGLITKKYKLNGRNVALFVLIVSTLNMVLFLSKAFISCNSVVNTVGQNYRANNYSFTSACNSECSCAGAKLFPVCDREGNAFFSPCHAGCREVKNNINNPSNFTFSSCECAVGGVVTKENCVDECKIPTVMFFATVIVGAFCGGMAIVPGMLILLRSVPPASRSISLGLQGFMVSLLGTLPSPIIWGSIIDTTCLVWDYTCNDERGACTIYDPTSLRQRMHFLFSFLRTIALLMDVYVWYQAKDLDILRDENDPLKKATEETIDDDAQKVQIALQPIEPSPQV